MITYKNKTSSIISIINFFISLTSIVTLIVLIPKVPITITTISIYLFTTLLYLIINSILHFQNNTNTKSDVLNKINKVLENLTIYTFSNILTIGLHTSKLGFIFFGINSFLMLLNILYISIKKNVNCFSTYILIILIQILTYIFFFINIKYYISLSVVFIILNILSQLTHIIINILQSIFTNINTIQYKIISIITNTFYLIFNILFYISLFVILI